MEVIKGIFNEFEFFNYLVKSWDLDFTLLSKGGFHADFEMTNNNDISISRVSLHGKILQNGLTPANSISFVIPNNFTAKFDWLNKDVDGSQLLIFPKSRELRAISMNDFDVYVFTVSHFLIDSLIEKNKIFLNKSIYNGDEQIIQMSKKEHHYFTYQASRLLQLEKNSGDLFNFQSKKLLESLLIFLSKEKPSKLLENNSFRYSILLKAIPIINASLYKKISITELCEKLNVSERSLQYAFKEHLDITPVSYINSVRLHHVKKRLFQLRHQKPSIADVAAEYSFYHMSGFSKSFKDKFGILPSEILQYP